MKRLVKLLSKGSSILDVAMDDARNITGKKKQHLASTFPCSSADCLINFTSVFHWYKLTDGYSSLGIA